MARLAAPLGLRGGGIPRVDWSNPLARGLVFLWAPQFYQIDLVSGLPAVLGASNTLTNSPYGAATNAGASGAGIKWTTAPPGIGALGNGGNVNITLAVLCDGFVASANGGAIGNLVASGANEIRLMAGQDPVSGTAKTNAIGFGINNAAFSLFQGCYTGNILTSGAKWQLVAGQTPGAGSNSAIFLNGVSQSVTISGGATLSSALPPNGWQVGRAWDTGTGAGFTLPGNYAWAAAWNRTLSTQEHALLYAEVARGNLPLIVSPLQQLFFGRGIVTVLARQPAFAEATSTQAKDNPGPEETLFPIARDYFAPASVLPTVRGMGAEPTEWTSGATTVRDLILPLELPRRVTGTSGAASSRHFIRRMARPRPAGAMRMRRVFFPGTSPTAGVVYYEAPGGAGRAFPAQAESAARMQRDTIPSTIEIIAAILADRSAPVEISAAQVRSDIWPNLEFLGQAGGGTIANSVLVAEWLATNLDRFPAYGEVLMGRLRAVPATVEAASTLRAARPVMIEGLANAAFLTDTIALIEAAALFRRDAAPGIEGMSALVRDSISPAEALGLPIAMAAAALRLEALATAAADPRIATEALSNLSILTTADAQLAIETAALFRRDMFGAAEASGTVTGDAVTRAELLALVAQSAHALAELLALARSDPPAAAETLAIAARDLGLGVEDLGQASVAVDALLRLEATARLSGGQSLAAAILATAARGSSAIVESAGTMRREATAAIEALGIIGADGAVRAEWQALLYILDPDQPLGIEWQQLSTMPLVSLARLLRSPGLIRGLGRYVVFTAPTVPGE